MNGVLIARYYGDDPTRPNREPDYKIKNHHVYLRPGFKKFINVLLHNFNVGIWSSISKGNLDTLCKTIFSPEQLKRFLFVLDGSYCTIIPNRYDEETKKPIMLKETKKLCEIYGINQDHLVLVDDSEYKAALNTSGISIHPSSYIGDINDKALCKNGEIYKELMSLLEIV
jgi:hypothetical protein